MKNGLRCWGIPAWPPLFVIAFLFALINGSAPPSVLADGCFVVPKFVWDKQRDINEPSQKAIIAYDSGQEEMLLQVKYDGPLEQFGWLIPVPNRPTVKKGSMDCFYELSKFTQKKLERGMYMAAMTKGESLGADAEEPPVTVVEVKTVGAYDIAVLTSTDAAALENWLKQNQYALPPDATGVIDTYVKQGWYFIAVKIDLRGDLHVPTAEKLASGELHPLQISFASERCVFPLKISSVNHTPSEVQVYVISAEPLIERGLFEKDMAGEYEFRTNQLARLAGSREQLRKMEEARMGVRMPLRYMPGQDQDNTLSMRSEIDREKLTEYAAVGQKDIPVCTDKMALLKDGKSRWLMKGTWTFQPEEMRDLEFEPAVPVLTAALADSEGAFAAGDLMRLGKAGTEALLGAMQSTNPVVRAHATAFAEEMVVAPANPQDEQPGQPTINPGLLRRLPTLLGDPDPEVRLHAAYAVENSASTNYFNRMLELVRDDNAEVSGAALGYLRAQRDEVPKHIPLYRQMIKDTNENVQIAGVRLLMSIEHLENADIPRAEWLALFSVPRMEVATVAVAHLGKQNITSEEAKPLLNNSNPVVRLVGFAVLMTHPDKPAVELTIPLLRDAEENLRLRAHDALTDLTGQNFPADRPEQWEQWWAQNQATFTVTITPEELRAKQTERMRERRRAAGPPPRFVPGQ